MSIGNTKKRLACIGGTAHHHPSNLIVLHNVSLQRLQMPASGPVLLNTEQLGKLKTELDVVQQNCKVQSEMLTELIPGSEDPRDLELLQVGYSPMLPVFLKTMRDLE